MCFQANLRRKNSGRKMENRIRNRRIRIRRLVSRVSGTSIPLCGIEVQSILLGLRFTLTGARLASGAAFTYAEKRLERSLDSLRSKLLRLRPAALRGSATVHSPVQQLS